MRLPEQLCITEKTVGLRVKAYKGAPAENQDNRLRGLLSSSPDVQGYHYGPLSCILQVILKGLPVSPSWGRLTSNAQETMGQISYLGRVSVLDFYTDDSAFRVCAEYPWTLTVLDDFESLRQL